MKITNIVPTSPLLVRTDSVPENSVVRWNGRPWLTTRCKRGNWDDAGWAISMDGAGGWLNGYTMVEVVDAELIVKS